MQQSLKDTKVLFLRNKNKIEEATSLKTLSNLGIVSSTTHYGDQSGLFEKNCVKKILKSDVKMKTLLLKFG
jgi:hypothetical protein